MSGFVFATTELIVATPSPRRYFDLDAETPSEIVRGQMPWVAHQQYGGMMCVVFADQDCEVPC